MRVLICIVLSCATVLRAADPTPDVVEFFRTAAQALADAHTETPRLPNDPAAFLNNFDPAMPGYAELRADIEELISRSAVGVSVEFVTDQGDGNKRTLDVDWTLEIENQRPRRAILKCTIERSGKKKWRITSLAPIDFFRY